MDDFRKENSSQIKTGQKKNETIIDEQESNSKPKTEATQSTKNRSLAKSYVYLVGDSMLYNIEAERLSTKRSFVRVRCFPGAILVDMEDYIRPLARKQPSHMIIHCVIR